MRTKPLLIFEGAELVGKSYLISQVYNVLEQQYNTSPHFLNGCHWFNADIGVYGGQYGRMCIEKYVEMAEAMPDACIIFEKLHITDTVYHTLYAGGKIQYTDIEARLAALGARIVFCAITPDEQLFAKRLADRLNLYPHYQRIAKTPVEYVAQQEAYKEALASSKLPVLTIDTTNIQNPQLTDQILSWIHNESR